MTSQYQHLHRVSLALNNIGVSLLEQGLYRFAGEAFQKSLFVLKYLVDERESKGAIDQRQIEELLRFLSGFVSPHRIQERFAGPRFISLDDDEINTGGRVLSPENSELALYLSSFTIIRLRGSSEEYSSQLEFEAGVVSRHLGIVLSIEADISRRPFDVSMKLFKASFTLLTRSYNGHNAMESQKKTIAVTAMLLDNTQALLRLQGRPEEAYAAMKNLSSLRETLRGMEKLTENQFQTAPMA